MCKKDRGGPQILSRCIRCGYPLKTITVKKSELLYGK